MELDGKEFWLGFVSTLEALELGQKTGQQSHHTTESWALGAAKAKETWEDVTHYIPNTYREINA
jgi:hypothetical protein